MKRLYKIFGATLLGFLLSAGLALAAVFIVPQGGTGAATFGSNAILYGNGTGAIQGSSATVGSTGAIATTIANTSNVVGLTVTQNDTTNNPKGISITNAGTNNGLYIDQNGNTGANNQTSGALVIDNTNNTGMGLQIYSDQASAVGLGSLLYVKADNASYAQPMVYLVQDGTAGAAATIRMDGPSPQIELVENDQASPAGKFEWQVQGDRMFFNGRNSGDSGFETIMILDRLGSAQIARASFAGPVVPVASDGASLGTSSLMWSDGFFASGAVLNFNADVTLTHASDKLTVAGGNVTLAAGTTSYGPLTLTSGTNMTTPAAGNIEYNGTQLFFSPSTTRNIVAQVSGSTAITANYIPYATTNGYLTSNANLQWDPTNARLGVGAVPSYRLHVIDTKVHNSGTEHTTSSTTTWTPTSASYTSNLDAVYGAVSLGAGTAVNSAASAYGRGGLFVASSATNSNINTLYGVTGQAINGTAATGTINSAYGIHGYVQNDAGTINNAFGAFSEIRNVGAGTITSGVGLYVDVTKSAGTITTVTGFKMIDFTSTVGTQYGVLTYGKSKFGGFNNLPTRVLESEIEGSATNVVDYPLRVTQSTSGTATTGFGVGQEFEAENASGTRKVIGTTEFLFSDATNTSEDATFKLRVVKAGTLTDAITVQSLGQTTFTSQYSPTKKTVTDASTIAIDWNDGNVQYVVIGATGRTVTFANPIDGARYLLMVKQDGTGSRTITTWPATILWAGGSAPTLTTTANKVDIIGCVYDGTNTKYYCSTSLNF